MLFYWDLRYNICIINYMSYLNVITVPKWNSVQGDGSLIIEIIWLEIFLDIIK